MAEDSKRKRSSPNRKTPSSKARAVAKPAPEAPPESEPVRPLRTLKRLPPKPQDDEPSLLSKLMDLPGSMAGSALNFVVKKTELPLRVGKSLLLKPDQAEVLEKAGKTFRELREVAGITLEELAQEVNLKDQSLLEAVENGTATLSFELIVRLASVLARHDPVHALEVQFLDDPATHPLGRGQHQHRSRGQRVEHVLQHVDRAEVARSERAHRPVRRRPEEEDPQGELPGPASVAALPVQRPFRLRRA